MRCTGPHRKADRTMPTMVAYACCALGMSAIPVHAQSPDWTVSLDHQTTALAGPEWREIHQTMAMPDSDERWTVRHLSPLDSPLALQRPDSQPVHTAIEWRKDWTALHERTTSGLEVSLTPHAGLGWSEGRSSAQAGATIRFGRGLDDSLDELAPDGEDTFGDRPRWYVFASGSKRAVGYNFTRQRDGGLSNEGLSQDSSHSLGDAAIGVAWRRGAMQSSVGIAYREVDIDGLRGYGGLKTDVDEARLAFQFSIRPQ